MSEYNKTEESIFTLLTLCVQITQAYDSIFDNEDIINSDFSSNRSSYHELINSAIHDALASQIILKSVAFIDEWNDFFGVRTEPEHREKILEIKRLVKPAYSGLKEWKDLYDYRNQAIAHNLRDKGQRNIFLLNKKFNAPQTDDELLLLAFCIHKIAQTVAAYFQDEVLRVKSILSEIIAYNNECRNTNHTFSKEYIEKINDIDDEITNSRIRYEFESALVDALSNEQYNEVTTRIIEIWPILFQKKSVAN